MRNNFYTSFAKPALDIVGALILFILFLPFFIIITVMLSFSVGNPFFKQRRVGYKLKQFSIVKFRTMNNAVDHHGNLLPDDQRLTRMGKFVRATSLDEMPQLLNIMLNEMSFIGPRPLLVDYLSLYSPEQIKRHDVKPGISGWAQVNGRNTIRWNEKFIYDVWYVNNISLWLDLKILAITIIKVLKSEGISGRGVATVEKFNGNN